MDTLDVTHWLDAYFAAWRTNDPGQVGALFATDAAYWVGPYAEPWRGRDEIVRRWTAGTGDLLQHWYNVLAVEGTLGVAHWRVEIRAGDGGSVELDGILVLTFNDAGECTAHREWYVTR
jgi:ketosteroid isomerase-like protein